MLTMANYTLMSAYEYGTIHDFGEKAGIINTRNYMTVINRLRKALESMATNYEIKAFLIAFMKSSFHFIKFYMLLKILYFTIYVFIIICFL